jgi:hypothetical protein
MSDQINIFDEVFRSKLSEQAIPPPDSVWNAIESKRSFGHVVANKISINWRTFGTMLLLLLGGGSSSILFGGEEQNEIPIYNQQFVEIEEAHVDKVPKTDELKITYSANVALDQTTTEQIKSEIQTFKVSENNIPDIELMASIEQAAFTRPIIKGDERLNILIQEAEGWETAKPFSITRYFKLNKIIEKPYIKIVLNPNPKLGDLNYDYAKQEVTRSTFKERTSILFAFTTQSITKNMNGAYNLSSSYLKKRQESEQTRLAYTFEVNFHYELKNNKFLESGVNFTQIYEAMSFKGEKQFSNQYDFLEIPLLLGFEDRNSKWGYQIKGGLGVQIFNNYKGFIYKRIETQAAPISNDDNSPQYRMRNTDAVKTIITGDHKLSKNQDPNEVLDLSKDEENPFKSGGVVNFHLAAGLTYYHSIKTTFIITPYYRRNVNSITKGDALFTEKITYMGVSLGTRFNF